jgi:hypothetical protein
MPVANVDQKYEMSSKSKYMTHADRDYMHIAHESESWFRACGGLSVL